MPLYDRPYMRVGPHSNRRNPLFWLLGILVAFFFAQGISGLVFHKDLVGGYLALTKYNLLAGRIWTLLTYSLVHGSAMHLIFNGLFLFFMGMPVLQLLGERKFIWLCIYGALGGAAGFILFHIGSPVWGVLGASAIAMAMLVVFCLSRMDDPITLLLFFVFPVTIKPRYLLLGALIIECIMLVPELQGTELVSSSAHLGGMAVGYLFFRKSVRGESLLPLRRRATTAVRRERRRAARSGQAPRYRVNIGSRSDLRGEVDRILDKINSQGFGSLTPEEKHLLDKARDILSK